MGSSLNVVFMMPEKAPDGKRLSFCVPSLKVCWWHLLKRFLQNRRIMWKNDEHFTNPCTTVNSFTVRRPLKTRTIFFFLISVSTGSSAILDRWSFLSAFLVNKWGKEREREARLFHCVNRRHQIQKSELAQLKNGWEWKPIHCVQ